MTSINDGVVEIELDGKTHELIPSVEACIEISSMAGGINAVVQKINMLNFEVICGVIAAGIQIDGKRLNPRQRDEIVPKAVYNSGLTSVAPA